MINILNNITYVNTLCFKYFGMFVKIGISLVIAIEVFTFTMLPYYYTGLSTNKILMKIFNNFSAGLFMGIAFLHIIPQANQKLKEWFQQQQHDHGHSHSGHDHSLPYGSLISIIIFMLILGLQVYFHDGQCGQDNHSNRHNYHMEEIISNEKSKMRRRLMFETYLTQLALSVHCFFQCMSIGIEKDQSVALVFASAIMFHKWAEGFTLGFSYANSGMPKQEALKFATFHAILNGSAVLIGLELSESNSLIQGVANAISGGTFIYLSIFQKINQSFKSKQDIVKKIFLVFSGLAFSIMILH